MTLTAGVKIPSAITQHAPYKVQTRSRVLTTRLSLIHAPLTGRPVKSFVESIVSVTVSNSESSWFRGVSFSRLRYRLKSIYKTNVPPTVNTLIPRDRVTFSLIISRAKDNPAIFDERDECERPDDTTGRTNNIFLRRTSRVWKNATISAITPDSRINTP